MRVRHLLLGVVALVACGAARVAWAQVPDSDIWVSEVLVRGQTLDLGKPVNVTHRAGYDNQPCFLADSQNLLFTSANAAGSTDIWRCNLGQKAALVQVTSTPESEYSPTPFGSPAAGFCTVRVEADSTQRMWRFDMEGKNPALVMSAVDSVGYFAWIDDTHVAAFILGNEKKKEPHTLRVIDVQTQAEAIVARNIGRSIQLIAGTHDISFTVQQGDEDRYRFFILKNGAHSGAPLIDAVGNGQDATWLGDTMLHSSGTTIYAAFGGGPSAFRPVRDFAAEGITGITRMAVAPDHSLIAFVAVSKPK